MNWDNLISIGIIGALILSIWAKFSHQTIPELISSIRDALANKGEESAEYVSEVVYD